MSHLDDDESPRVHLVNEEEHSLRNARIDLYDLIAKGQRIVKLEDARKKLQEQSTTLQAAQQARANAIAAKFAWEANASVVMFEVQVCRHCGTEHRMFRGFGTRFHRKADAIVRIAAADCIDRGLPLVHHETLASSQICASCVDVVAAPMQLIPHEFHPQRKETAG